MPPKPTDDEDDPTDESLREGRGTTLISRGTERRARVPPKSSARRKGAKGEQSHSAKGARRKRRSPIELSFNGSLLTVTRSGDPNALARFSATSGLPPGAPHVRELIARGRKDLDVRTDYRKPKYQSIPDAGPIPEDSYELPLVKNMPFQKTGGGWGLGGWRLERSYTRVFRAIALQSASVTSPLLGWLLSENIRESTRAGFFLHHDGGAPGTAGCVGIKRPDDFTALKQILVEAQAQGQHSATLRVEYK